MMFLDNALFTYTISKQKNILFPQHIYIPVLDCYVNYTNKTDIVLEYTGEKSLAIIGLCIDAHADIPREKIAIEILSFQGNIEEIYKKCDRFAGKYVMIYCNGDNCYILGDATTSIQINYGFGNNNSFCIASTDKMVADCLGNSSSERLKKMRLGSELVQPMPGDLTMYEGIYALLPICWGLTFLCVVICWVFFRAETFADGLQVVSAMFGIHSACLVWHLNESRKTVCLVLLALTILLAWAPSPQRFLEKRFCPSKAWAFVVIALALMALTHLTQYSEFLYFQF